MDARTFTELLDEHLTEPLQGERLAALEQALRETPDFRREFEAQRTLVACLSQPELVTPPAGMHDRIMAAVQRERLAQFRARAAAPVPRTSWLAGLVASLRHNWQVQGLATVCFVGVVVLAVVHVVSVAPETHVARLADGQRSIETAMEAYQIDYAGYPVPAERKETSNRGLAVDSLLSPEARPEAPAGDARGLATAEPSNSTPVATPATTPQVMYAKPEAVAAAGRDGSGAASVELAKRVVLAQPPLAQPKPTVKDRQEVFLYNATNGTASAGHIVSVAPASGELKAQISPATPAAKPMAAADARSVAKKSDSLADGTNVPLSGGAVGTVGALQPASRASAAATSMIPPTTALAPKPAAVVAARAVSKVGPPPAAAALPEVLAGTAAPVSTPVPDTMPRAATQTRSQGKEIPAKMETAPEPKEAVAVVDGLGLAETAPLDARAEDAKIVASAPQAKAIAPALAAKVAPRATPQPLPSATITLHVAMRTGGKPLTPGEVQTYLKGQGLEVRQSGSGLVCSPPAERDLEWVLQQVQELGVTDRQTFVTAAASAPAGRGGANGAVTSSARPRTPGAAPAAGPVAAASDKPKAVAAKPPQAAAARPAAEVAEGAAGAAPAVPAASAAPVASVAAAALASGSESPRWRGYYTITSPGQSDSAAAAPLVIKIDFAPAE
jgi:hypothetical protein